MREKNTELIGLYVTPTLKARLEQAATEAKVSLSEYMRCLAEKSVDPATLQARLEKEVKTRSKVSMQSYMRKVGQFLIDESGKEFEQAFRAGMRIGIRTAAPAEAEAEEG